MPFNEKRRAENTIGKFIDWLHDNAEPSQIVTVDHSDRIAYIEANFIDCDTAVAHGPGHQSVTPCGLSTPGHTRHSTAGYPDIEWDDDDIHPDRTYDMKTYAPPDYKTKVTRTYRLATGPHYFG